MDYIDDVAMTVDYAVPDPTEDVPGDSPVRQSQWWKDYHRPQALPAKCTVTFVLGAKSTQALQDLVVAKRRQPTLEEFVAILQEGK